MTQYTDKVLQVKLLLEKEKDNNTITFIEARNGSITTAYKSGKRITEFDDKRKKPLIEYY
jgi:hypothetical protein|tara:strand:+ start:257 stop:436 length:180 start_codon:yes stop_codon:yes gene_type:complete